MSNLMKYVKKMFAFFFFILAHFNYCPMVWHFCGKASTKKIELIHERALRFLLNDQKSTYHELIEKYNYTTMLIRRIITISMEDFKSLHDLNPNFLKEMFLIKELKYSLSDSNIIYQPKFQKVTYGKNIFKYYGPHIWNLLPNEIKETADILFFKSLIMTWEGPKCQCNMCNILI